MRKNIEALVQAQGCYAALDRYRRDRERNKRYHYGDQWSDTINVGGRRITEAKFIEEQGSVPLKNNLIRRLVRNVIGVYSSQAREPQCQARDKAEAPLGATMTQLLRYNAEANRLKALYARSLEEFLIGGLVVHRKWYGRRGRNTDCWTDYVQPSHFFVDADMRDFRGWDCSCVGQIHDITFGDLCSQFAHSEADYAALRDIYASASDPECLHQVWHDFGFPSESMHSFVTPSNPAMCRVIEIWRKEHTAAYVCHDPAAGTISRVDPARFDRLVTKENERRRRRGKPLIKWQWQVSERWRYYFLSPLGDVLAEGDTPYAHGSHPYVMKAYPMIDGEVHAFVSDVIDQQRYTNRLITMYDWIIRSSAKGVLLVPEDCIPRGVNPNDFAEAWSRFNGVIVFRPSQYGQVPQQVASNATNVGIVELLNLQLQFFEDVSGVSSALQGKVNHAATSAEMYGQQTQNATATLLDLLDAFSEFVRDAAYVDVSNMQQYYDPERVRQIVGADASIDPARAMHTAFDLSIAPCLSTPASRQASNQLLLEIWKSGQISLDQLLDAGDFPFAAALRSSQITENTSAS